MFPTASLRGRRSPCGGRSISRSGFFGGRAALRDEVIEQLDLGRLLRQPIGTLSKGQRKRALLGIGLLTPQPALLIDEPFDGLDLRQARDIAAALRAHAARGRTLFLSIHQISDAARFCDRFVLLSGGRVCGEGTVPELAALAAARDASATVRGPGRGVSCAHVGPPFLWLLDKEWRELLVSRSWWVLLLGMGPLVGVSFISAVRTYAEVSGLNGTSAGVGEALSPLIGVWAPTFSACELAAVFLLPFVAIRLVAGDRQSGALKLELQQGMSAVCPHRGEGAGAAGGLADRDAAAAQRHPAVEELRRQRLRAGTAHADRRPRAQRGADDRAWRGHGVASPNIPRRPRF